MKIMDKLDETSENELKIHWNNIDHKNIVKYYDHFNKGDYTFLITEYCPVI